MFDRPILDPQPPPLPDHRFGRAALPGLAAVSIVLASIVIATTAGPPPGEAVAAPSGDDYSSDESGYLDSSARCDADQTLMAFGRTSRAMVAVCVDPDGELEYRGVRLSDQAAATLTATRASDGSIIATNDGVTYAISPTFFLVSEGDSVLYRDSWIEFRQPRFSGTPTTSTTSTTTSAAASTAPTTTPTVSTPTVSTTTVTMAPVTPAGR
jgi:hypothetical protein